MNNLDILKQEMIDADHEYEKFLMENSRPLTDEELIKHRNRTLDAKYLISDFWTLRLLNHNEDNLKKQAELSEKIKDIYDKYCIEYELLMNTNK